LSDVFCYVKLLIKSNVGLFVFLYGIIICYIFFICHYKKRLLLNHENVNVVDDYK